MEGLPRTIAVPLETLAFVVVTVREFDLKLAPADLESGSDALEDVEAEYL